MRGASLGSRAVEGETEGPATTSAGASHRQSVADVFCAGSFAVLSRKATVSERERVLSIRGGPSSAGPEGQRAHVTLLFSDLCSYTVLGELSDPEETEGLRYRIEELAERIVQKHRGIVSQCYGDGILAVFGLPVCEEDDSRRAVEAALEFHQAVRELVHPLPGAPDFELRMHSGVHAGLIFARVGDDLHGRYDITGDAVSTAARLASAAGRDQIVVSDSTLRGAEAFFALEPAQELTLKGKRDPVLVHRVLGRSQVRTRFEARIRAGLTPFAGRDDVLERLVMALEQSRLGKGQLVYLSGPAGIGKTRTLEEFRLRATGAGVLVVRGGCESYGELPPLEPVLQVLKQLFSIELGTSSRDAREQVERCLVEWGVSDEHSGTILCLLSLARGRPAGAQLDVNADSTLRALAALFETLSQRFPLALLFDDWQWADESSRSVLSRLAPVLEERGVCVILALRDDALSEALPHPSLSLRLEPFSHEESRRVISVLRAKDLDVGLTSALHARSGGNPLFLEELCRALSEDVLHSVQALERCSVPNTLQGLIQARTAKLASSQINTLQRASVIGLEFSSALLFLTADRAQVEADLATLVHEGLLYPAPGTDNFRFKHGIAREVVYSSVRIHERRRIHHEIATALAHNVATNGLVDQSEALAFHYRGSGDDVLAAEHAEYAGDKAALGSFLESARSHYEAALDSLDRLSPTPEVKRRWLRVSEKWGAQCAYAPTRAQVATLQRADVYAGELADHQSRARTNHMLAWFHYVLGDYADSLADCQRSVGFAHEGADAKLLVQLETALGQAYSVSGRYTQALGHLDQGIEQKRARKSTPAPGDEKAAPSRHGGRTPPFLYAHSLTHRAMIFADMGQFERADCDLGEALAIVDGTGHAMEASVLSHECIIELRRGDFRKCHETAVRACALAERVKSVFVFGISSAFERFSCWRLEPTEASCRDLRKAVDWLEARDFGLYISFVYACLAEALYESGEKALARDYVQRVLQRARVDDPQGEVIACRVMARLSAEERAPQQVEEWLARGLRVAAARDSRRELALTSLCSSQLRWTSPHAAPYQRLSTAGLLGIADVRLALEQMGMKGYAAQAHNLADHEAEAERAPMPSEASC